MLARSPGHYLFSLAVLLLSNNPLFALATPILAKNLICPDTNPANCYPRIFEPSTQWQKIKEGQEIPPGLHVRMNMATHLKEAKVLDDNTPETGSLEQVLNLQPGNAIVAHVAESEEEVEHIKLSDDTLESHKGLTHANRGSETSQLSFAMNEIRYLSELADQAPLDLANRARLLGSLTILEDLAHDMEYGEELTRSDFGSHLLRFSTLANEPAQEKCLQIMAAMLRNNPLSLSNTLAQQPHLITQILERLEREPSVLLTKRALSVLGAIILDPNGRAAFDEANGMAALVALHDKIVNTEAYTKYASVFEDMGTSYAAERKTVPAAKRAATDDSYLGLETRLVMEPLSELETQQVFSRLVALKQADPTLKPSERFMVWVAQQAVDRQAQLALRKRDASVPGDDVFDLFLVEARHAVFGNPNAMRKGWSE